MFSIEEKNKIDEKFKLSTNNYLGLIDDINDKLSKLSEDEKYCMKYIYANLPISDIGDYSFNIYLSFTKHSIFVREKMPWGKKIPIDLFLTDILFPRINNEKIDDHRKPLYDIFYKYIENIEDMYKAVAEINYASLEYGTYRLPSRRTASPLTFLTRTFGRCGEESTFLAAVLKSVGIPARQIYTPRWPHCDDCHAWVEAWCDGKWHYLGACEPEPFLDKGWFNAASARSMLLHARVFDNTNEYKDKITNEGPITTISRTEAYANSTRTKVIVRDKNGPVKNADVRFELVNYAQFTSISDLYTDEKGEVSIVTGYGSLNIHVIKNGEFVEKIINTKDAKVVEIDFSKAKIKEDEYIEEFDMIAPIDAGNHIKTLTKEEVIAHKERITKGNDLREKRENGGVSNINEYTNKKEYIVEKELEEILEKAKLNGGEVLKYLNSAKSKYNFLTLKTLDDKDLVDLDKDTLNSHVEYSLEYADKYDQEQFIKYILAPRISYEEITPYKGFISKYFTDKEKGEFKDDPKKAFEYIKENIKFIKSKNFTGIVASPKTVLTLKEGNEISKHVLFVAILRTIGICARLNPITKIPEYMENGKFKYCEDDLNKNGKIKLIPQIDVNWSYGTNWSIGRLIDGEYITSQIRVKPEDIIDIDFIPGNYRIITANRLPNGNMHNKKYVFEVKKGEAKEIELSLKDINFKEMFLNIKLNDFKVINENKEIEISNILDNGNNLVIWLGEAEEPTEHILNEMADSNKEFNKLDLNIIFICKNEKAFENKNIQRVIGMIPKIKTCIDKDFYMQEPIARNLYIDPGKLPLVMVTQEKLNAIYGFSGYNVGIADLIGKIVSVG